MSKFTPSRSNVNNLRINGKVGYEQGPDLTLASGVITVTHSYHRVMTEVSGDPDTVTEILGASASDIGQILILQKVPGGTNPAITVADAGDINLEGGSKLLDNDKDTLMLIWHGSKWIQLSHSNNHGS